MTPDRRPHDPFPPSHRELDETTPPEVLDPGTGTAEDRARVLFVHGLLEAQAEARRPDARERQETRIQEILAGLEVGQASDTSPEILAMPTRRSPLRALLGIAAAILVATAAVFAWQALDRVEVPELLAKASEAQSKGLHIYEGSFEIPRRGPQAFRLALTDGGRLQFRIESSKGPFDFGSDGKGAWFKTPTAPKAISVPFWELEGMLRQLPEGTLDLGPDLGFLEIEQVLGQILTKEGLKVLGREEDAKGRSLVALQGRYNIEPKRRQYRSRRHSRRHRHHYHHRRLRERARPVTGAVSIRIEEESGRLASMRFTEDGNGRVTRIERVLSLPHAKAEGRPTWIDFEPEFLPMEGGFRVWSLFRRINGILWKRRWEARRKAREEAEKTGGPVPSEGGAGRGR